MIKGKVDVGMGGYLRFLFGMLKVGCIGFGGGTALVPVLEEEFVHKQKLKDKQTFDEDVIVAGITPGALPVEVAAAIGKHAFGYKGLLGGPVMIALPGILLSLALFTVFSVVNDAVLEWVKIISIGASAFIIYLLCHYVIQVFVSCKKESRERLYKALIVVAAVCVMVCGSNIVKLFGWNVTPLFRASTVHVLIVAFFFVFYTRGHYTKYNVLLSVLISVLFLWSHGKSPFIAARSFALAIEVVMIVLAIWGVVTGMREEKSIPKVERREMAKELLVWILFFAVLSLPSFFLIEGSIPFVLRGMLSSFMSFGGGDAYLTIADGLFVGSGLISEEAYYGQVTVVVNVLPGSILCKTLAGIGYYIGYGQSGRVTVGICLAIAGLSAGVAASCGLYRMVGYVYRSIHSFSLVRIFERWFRPIFAGLLINLILSLCIQGKKTAANLNVPEILLVLILLLLAGLDLLLEQKGIKPMWILLVNLGIVLLLAFALMLIGKI